MLLVLRTMWKSLAGGMFLLGLFWLPADVQSYDQALGPWQRLWALVDRETLLWVFALGLFAWLVWTDVRPFVRGRMAKRFPPRHAEVCEEIAKELRQLRSDALSATEWVDSEKGEMDNVMWYQFKNTLNRIDELLAEISYDPVTDQAVRSFMSRCAALVIHALDDSPKDHIADEMREMAGPLFQSLHTAKPLNPALIPEPRWPESTALEKQQ